MNRQHATPIWRTPNGTTVPLEPLAATGETVDEFTIQKIIFDHPSSLPITDIDPIFAGAIPICLELNTLAGPIDLFMVTPSGLPVLVECKLWKNSQARREVVGQIIDYAKELSRWTSADLDREVSKRCAGKSLIEIVRKTQPNIVEIEFNDAVSRNLRLGRFLLLIVGDGIREGVEAITDYVQRHAGLHFTLGLVELPIFRAPDGGYLFAPRVVSRTTLIARLVVESPAGHMVVDSTAVDDAEIVGVHPMTKDRIDFWTDFLSGLTLDDKEQPVPKASDIGSLSFMMPAPRGSCWLTVYRNAAKNRVGVFLSYSRNSVGEQAVLAVLDRQDEYIAELGGDPDVEIGKDGRKLLTARLSAGSLADPAQRAEAFAWLRARTNEFVNVFRPRIRSLVADVQAKTHE